LRERLSPLLLLLLLLLSNRLRACVPSSSLNSFIFHSSTIHSHTHIYLYTHIHTHLHIPNKPKPKLSGAKWPEYRGVNGRRLRFYSFCRVSSRHLKDHEREELK
jgi:hypothetical protein